MNLIDTKEQSLMTDFFPPGWDLNRIDACCALPPERIYDRQSFWHDDFHIVSCPSADAVDIMIGHEIAFTIQKAKHDGRELVLMMSTSPMSMYAWAVYFLQQWNVDCGHVHSFIMNEWSDKDGNAMDSKSRASFAHMIMDAFFTPLGELTIPLHHRNFATQSNLPKYSEKITALKNSGALVVTTCGIGRMMHLALWEPQFAAEFSSEEEWKAQDYRKGAKLHPLTIEQYSITRFGGRTTLVPCFANTIGPGLILKSDYVIGGVGGSLAGNLIWQAMPLWTTLRYGPSVWIPSTFLPTMPGKLFFHKNLAGPLEPVRESVSL
jgi:glucosamine-6-phosphate deaminase